MESKNMVAIIMVVLTIFSSMLVFSNPASASEPKTLAVGLNIPVSDIVNGSYLYNPDGVVIANTSNGLPFGVYSDKSHSIVGFTITNNQIKEYMVSQNMIPKYMVVNKIEGYVLTFDLDISNYSRNIAYYTEYQRIINHNNIAGNEPTLCIWVGNPNAPQVKIPDYVWASVNIKNISSNEIAFTPVVRDEISNSTPNNYNAIMDVGYQAFGWQTTYSPDDYPELYPYSPLSYYYNGTPEYFKIHMNNDLVAKIHNYVVVNFNKGNNIATISETPTLYINNPNGETYKNATRTLPEIETTTSDIPSDLIGVYMTLDQRHIKNATFSSPLMVGTVKIVATVEVAPNTSVQSKVMPIVSAMGVIGLTLMIFGFIKYDKDYAKGTGIALGLALIISALVIYAVPHWYESWTFVLLPTTLTILFLYLMTYTGVIDTTKHTKLEYWMLKWGDALSLVLLVILLVEMWSGIFTQWIHPFWGW